MKPAKLPAAFYRRDTVAVARDLLGKRLCRRLDDGRVLSGIIVETEAYVGAGDRASHAFNDRRTARTETMYAAGGVAYVYLIYGMYSCLNAVTRNHGEPEAVLIRALQPEREEPDWVRSYPRLKPRQWLSGPGRLCRALHIDRSLNGISLRSDTLWVEQTGVEVEETMIVAGPRIGVGYAGEAAQWPLRFFLRGNAAVSGSRQADAVIAARQS